jgi:hypothetical protein
MFVSCFGFSLVFGDSGKFSYHCRPTEYITQWNETLKEHTGISEYEAEAEAEA